MLTWVDVLNCISAWVGTNSNCSNMHGATIKIIYSCKRLYMFRTVFPSIIRSSKLRIQQEYMVKQLLQQLFDIFLQQERQQWMSSICLRCAVSLINLTQTTHFKSLCIYSIFSITADGIFFSCELPLKWPERLKSFGV